MSVHSHMAAQHEAAAPEFPQHVVTAVLVAHDGGRWLPEALSGLFGQERPVQDVIAADTGSADETSRLLTESLGQGRVLHMARRTGFGTAADEAERTAPVLGPDELAYLRRPSGWDPVNRVWRDEAYDMPELPYGEPEHWLWLLHDDCAPEPDALAQLLRLVDADPSVAVAGPKLRSWYDGRQLLEAGVSIANSGRRWTGVERREHDQGQHDQVRPVLAVSTAGMLIRRDVFRELGGFDRRLPLMRDDVDLCWRAQSAGHRVFVAPDAVMRHAEAASRERRPVDCVGRSSRHGASPHRVDKAGAVYTLLANMPTRKLTWVLLRLVFGTLLRTLAYLVGKVPGQALDEVTGLSGTLLRPGRLLVARRRRGRPAVPYNDLRALFPPPGATLRATAEQVASNFGGRSEPELSSGGRHGAVETGPGGEDADFIEVEQFARLKRIARKPGPVLFVVLLVVSLIACRALLGSGALAGGALLPAPAHVTELWSRFAGGWHPVGIGGTQTAPPYLGVVALVATLLFGSTGFALTLLLVCSVPLAGLSAYFMSRPLVESRLLRAWGSVSYAFLPAATGALAGGRIGTAVLAIVLPVLARVALAVSGLRGRRSWRAAWALGLLLSFTTAFTPVVWPVTLVLAAVLLVHVRRSRQRQGLRGTAGRLLIAVGTPMVLLAPWSLSLLASPSGFLREAGLPYGKGAASALDLLTLTPGGPGATAGLLLAGFVLAALAALLRAERRFLICAAWVVALDGLLFAALSNGSAWAGPSTLVYGLGLLCAAAVGAEGAKERVAEQSFGWRQPVGALIAATAVAAPLFAAVGWMIGGADGPLSRRDPVQVPAFVAEESSTRDQARTLVLSGNGGGGASQTPSGVSYSLVRGSGGRLGDGDLAASGGTDARLGGVVANLVAGSGADQKRQLGDYAVRYVLLRGGAPRQMSRELDATPGLTRLSQEDGSKLWRLDREVSRVSILSKGASGSGSGSGSGGGGAAAKPVPVAAGPVEAHTQVRSGSAGRVLRVADAADSGWQATLDGKPLAPVTLDGWAQGFRLPAGGGHLDVTYETSLTHTVWVWAQGLLLAFVVVLALPGRRSEVDDDLPETAAPVPPQPVEGEGRRARRLRAAAGAAGAGAGTQAAEADAAAGVDPMGLDPTGVDPAGFDQTGEPAVDAVDAPHVSPEPPQVPEQADYGQHFQEQVPYTHYSYGAYDEYGQPMPYDPDQDPYGQPAQYAPPGQYEQTAQFEQFGQVDQYPPYGHQYPPYGQQPSPPGHYGQYESQYEGQQYAEWEAAQQQYGQYAGSADPYGYDPAYDPMYGNRSDQQ